MLPNIEAATAKEKWKDKCKTGDYGKLCGSAAARKSDCDRSTTTTTTTTTSCGQGKTDDCGFAKEFTCPHVKDKNTKDENKNSEKKKTKNAKDACLDSFKSMVFSAMVNAGSSGGRDRSRDSVEPGASGVTSVSSNGKDSGKSHSSRQNKGQSHDVVNSNRSANDSTVSSFWDEDPPSKAPSKAPLTQGNHQAKQV